MSRPHLIHAIVDENGDLRRYTRVRVLNADGSKYTGKIYRDRLSQRLWSNPFVAAPALLDIYLDRPARIRLGVVYDTTKPEEISEVLTVSYDADQTVSTSNSLMIEGPQPEGALLCAIDEDSAYWKPLRVDHEHEGVAPRSTLAGPIEPRYRQAGAFEETTTLGGDSGGWGAASSLRGASMLGSRSNAYGRGTTALGRDALATESEVSPWRDGATALGGRATAQAEGIAIGTEANAEAISGSGAGLSPGVVALAYDTNGAPNSLVLGSGARASVGGIALGSDTGSLSAGPPDSIGIGAGAQYGLPSDQVNWAILLGAADPNRTRTFPWANPASSQSESPWDEYAPTMAFAGSTVQLQRHLTWLADIAGLTVEGNTTLGGPEGTLGFYGATPKQKLSVGDDEPGSGITALDNLIYALRELGLVKFRSEATVLFRAEDLLQRYRTGDQITDWPEHFGTDTASYVRPGVPPTFTAEDSRFNGFPSLGFSNGVYRQSVRPVQELRGNNLLPSTKHFVVIAAHGPGLFGYFEGLVNLSANVISADNTVFMSQGATTTTWQPDNAARYDRDGLNQTSNMDAGLPAPHAYRMTNRHVWPHGRPIIGGPRDQANAGYDRWSGPVVDVAGLDSTWEEGHVQSLMRGLMFRYGIGQNPATMQNPAQDFLLTQHDPAGGTFVFWSKDYSDGFLGKCYGRATRVPKPIVYIPFISIYISFNIFSFRGSLVGNWGNISFSHEYEVAISVKAGDFDNDGDIDVDVDFDVETETHIGVFSLNNNLTWSMGQLSSRYGHKICRIRHRVTKTVVCISGDPPFRYADTEVRVYSTRPDGSLLLEGTSPLWGDGTFSVRVRNAGRKVARVYEKSTGNLLGTTEYHETALPRTTIYAADDPDVSVAARDRAYVEPAALTAMAFCDLDSDRRYRSRHIVQTLAKVQNDDGSLMEFYSSALPAKGAGVVYARSSAWSLLAMLRYQADTGDAQFLPKARKLGDWLVAERVLNGLIRTTPGSVVATTVDNVLAYFALRDLGTLTGTTSYQNAATGLRSALLAQSWLPAQRWAQAVGDDRESLWATALGGLFALAVGDRPKARESIRSLKRFRVKNQKILTKNYHGSPGLIGYRSFADAGTTPYVNPPSSIDAAGTWLAILFKARYGEPIGDDVTSMLRWSTTAITDDPTHALFGAQFLNYSSTATAAPYGWRARPNLATAAWGFLMSKGARHLFTPDPLPAPIVDGLVVTVERDPAAARLNFRYTWSATGVFAAYEAIPEQSVNAGGTWTPVATAAVSGPIEPVRTPTGFAASWSLPTPENTATLYRVRVRLRNAAFGGWATSPNVSVPST